MLMGYELLALSLANSTTMDNPVYDLGQPSRLQEDERELDNPIYGQTTEDDSTAEGTYDTPGDTNHFDAVYSVIETDTAV